MEEVVCFLDGRKLIFKYYREVLCMNLRLQMVRVRAADVSLSDRPGHTRGRFGDLGACGA